MAKAHDTPPAKTDTHTKGPWSVTKTAHQYLIQSPADLADTIPRYVAATPGRQGKAAANARLIAAAPDQHEALEAIRNDCEAWLAEETDIGASDLLVAIQAAADAALAKAEIPTA